MIVSSHTKIDYAGWAAVLMRAGHEKLNRVVKTAGMALQ
jgi:hypothetical protein